MPVSLVQLVKLPAADAINQERKGRSGAASVNELFVSGCANVRFRIVKIFFYKILSNARTSFLNALKRTCGDGSSKPFSNRLYRFFLVFGRDLTQNSNCIAHYALQRQYFRQSYKATKLCRRYEVLIGYVFALSELVGNTIDGIFRSEGASHGRAATQCRCSLYFLASASNLCHLRCGGAGNEERCERTKSAKILLSGCPLRLAKQILNPLASGLRYILSGLANICAAGNVTEVGLYAADQASGKFCK